MSFDNVLCFGLGCLIGCIILTIQEIIHRREINKLENEYIYNYEKIARRKEEEIDRYLAEIKNLKREIDDIITK